MPPEPQIMPPKSRLTDIHKIEEFKALRKEVIRFMGIMEGRVRDLANSCEALQIKAASARIGDFTKFQTLAAENLTFLIIIEKRLEQVPENIAENLGDRFDELVVAVWSIVMKGSLSYLISITEENYLPLGAREIFVRELKTLNDAHTQLSRKRYRKKISKEIRSECKKAERIIMLIIDRAPSLLAF